MKKIFLTRGQYTLVDDEDFEYLNQWKWTAHRISNKILTMLLEPVIKMAKRLLGCID